MFLPFLSLQKWMLLHSKAQNIWLDFVHFYLSNSTVGGTSTQTAEGLVGRTQWVIHISSNAITQRGKRLGQTTELCVFFIMVTSDMCIHTLICNQTSSSDGSNWDNAKCRPWANSYTRTITSETTPGRKEGRKECITQIGVKKTFQIFRVGIPTCAVS